MPKGTRKPERGTKERRLSSVREGILVILEKPVQWSGRKDG